MMLKQAEVEQYKRDGYTVARGLFPRATVEALCEHFMRLRALGSYPGDSAGIPLPGQAGADDPWKRYPRMIHMHRWDETTLRWFIDPRLRDALHTLLGRWRDPFAVQTMFYFKPPGGRGQALHQDQFYLHAQPGTCVVAWMAVDPCDEENGCLQVVPGSHLLPLLCTVPADTTQSITDVTVPLAGDMLAVPVIMQPGDVLFFNGQLVHGSLPNTSRDRFRRVLIGHYVTGDAARVADWFRPALRMDGTVGELGTSEGGGPCGVWVERDGRAMVDMVDAPSAAGTRHE